MIKREVTQWYDGSLHSPSMIGWYNVVLKTMFDDPSMSEEDKYNRRRFWNGIAFSGVVFIGDDNEEQLRSQSFNAAAPEEVFWRGCAKEQFQ